MSISFIAQSKDAAVCTHACYDKTEPVPGKNIPIDATVVPFVMQNNDEEISHYKIENGVLFYIPQQDGKPPAPVDPVSNDDKVNARLFALEIRVDKLEGK